MSKSIAFLDFPRGSAVKNLPEMKELLETQVQSLVMETYSSVLA